MEAPTVEKYAISVIYIKHLARQLQVAFYETLEESLPIRSIHFHGITKCNSLVSVSNNYLLTHVQYAVPTS